MILLAVFVKIVLYAIAFLVTLLILGVKYLKFSSDLKEVEKKVDFLRDNSFEAKKICDQLTNILCECKADTDKVFEKLNSLKYQKDFGSHTIYLCLGIDRSNFLLITLYEYLNTEIENSTEKLFEYDYLVKINHVDSQIQVLSNQSLNEFDAKSKSNFLNKFLINHLDIEEQK